MKTSKSCVADFSIGEVDSCDCDDNIVQTASIDNDLFSNGLPPRIDGILRTVKSIPK